MEFDTSKKQSSFNEHLPAGSMQSQQAIKQTFSFSGHETFPFRYAWLKKGYDAVKEDPKLFTQEDRAMVILGVGKNMVRSIRHWCLAANVIMPISTEGRPSSYLQPTSFGDAIFGDEKGIDPFLEDIATIWVLHWQIVSRPDRCTTWHWAFSHVHESEFSKAFLLDALGKWTALQGVKRASENTLERDIDCFVRTYLASRDRHHAVIEDSLDCPLTELDMLHESPDREFFRFHRGPKDHLSPSIILYSVNEYWKAIPDRTNSLSLADLSYAPGSPGRVFQLDEGSLANALENVEELSKGAILYDDTSGLRQLLRNENVDSLKLLRQIYSVQGWKRKRVMTHAT